MTLPTRRDWQLQQLGMTQWVLRRPAVLQGEIAVTLPPDARLVLVTERVNALSDPFVMDVLRSLGVHSHQVLQIAPERAVMLPADKHCNSWCLGVEVPLALSGAKLHSVDLDELYLNSAARRALWQQICSYEHDLFSTAE
ncbi:DNA polymerase III subunit psi [Citrobacter sp. JGM124]|uniref:DNA polymerase III subunit psi n=1 Tax=Citrobacter sp. JGM124 TaxID=2799789 RepID=UPI001BA707AD|nr:DNA polymerase III subunit psi [Citrobacter sp. JGM124]MBS0848381.1 DNA polymerase III subunit psi [Citrobacter sp. JGM124]